MKIWTAIRDAPLWVLRAGFAVVGLVDGVGLAVLLAAFLIDFGPPVDVTVRNESPHDVTVRLDSVEREPIAGSGEATLTDDDTGEHRLELLPDAPDAIQIALLFDADRWGTTLSVEVLAADGSPSVR